MTLFEQVKNIPEGAIKIAQWLGSGGHVVTRDVSQRRADICNGDNPTRQRCPNNVHDYPLTETVAKAVKATLEVKNHLQLKVRGEKMLGSCGLCGCALKLIVHEPQDRVVGQLTDTELTDSPKWCWKLKQNE